MWFYFFNKVCLQSTTLKYSQIYYCLLFLPRSFLEQREGWTRDVGGCAGSQTSLRDGNSPLCYCPSSSSALSAPPVVPTEPITHKPSAWHLQAKLRTHRLVEILIHKGSRNLAGENLSGVAVGRYQRSSREESLARSTPPALTPHQLQVAELTARECCWERHQHRRWACIAPQPDGTQRGCYRPLRWDLPHAGGDDQCDEPNGNFFEFSVMVGEPPPALCLPVPGCAVTRANAVCNRALCSQLWAAVRISFSTLIE